MLPPQFRSLAPKHLTIIVFCDIKPCNGRWVPSFRRNEVTRVFDLDAALRECTGTSFTPLMSLFYDNNIVRLTVGCCFVVQ